MTAVTRELHVILWAAGRTGAEPGKEPQQDPQPDGTFPILRPVLQVLVLWEMEEQGSQPVPARMSQ